MIPAKASKDSTNTWDEEKGKGIHKVAGEVKPSVDGEKEGIKIRHGNYESAAGTDFTNSNNAWGSMSIFFFPSNNLDYFFECANRRKDGNVGRGMGRKLIMISIKRLYAKIQYLV